ncbi:hypothetical protein [Nocardiopsis sp. Huas11]|uniref:hypothetical protein n=1 Tax=Nocardiopsis sp. Huas11 TaxID=2183912 RepID=UPI000EACB1DB|nr:hypothetical protein [Nocardiopsis sp. Huas11]
MILSILATVAVLAAIATIAAALFLAEITLVYIALGLGGISVLLLAAALIQGGLRKAGQDRTRTGTDGLGKSSVPAVATTAATPPGTHSVPEDSGRVPAPASGPVRDSVVSEHGSTGFTPAAGEWPEAATGSPDPDPARPYGHAADAPPAAEPETFDYRIPHQGRFDERSWAATPSGHDAVPDPAPEESEAFADRAPSRADEPEAGENEEHVLPAPSGVTPDEEPNAFDAFDSSGHAPGNAAEAEVEETAVGETARSSAWAESQDQGSVDDADADEDPGFHYRVPTADARDEVDPVAHETYDEPDDARVTSAADEAAESDADTVEGAFSYRVPTAAVEPAGSGADEFSDFSGQVPDAVDHGPTGFDDASDADAPVVTDTDSEETAGFSYRVPSPDDHASAEPSAVDEGGENQAIFDPSDVDEAEEPAEPSGVNEDAWVEPSERNEDAGADAFAESSAVDETAEPAEPSDLNDDAGADESAGSSGESAEDGGDADETATFSYRVPSTDTDQAPDPHAGEASAFTYRAPAAETEEDSDVAYAAILDAEDEPSSGDGPSRRDPDQVS